MPQIINTNIASLNAQRHLNSSQSEQRTALERLSSGLRINSAKDDAAGMAISTRFDTQVRGLNVSMRNSNDGVSLAQVAEGSLSAIANNLQRIRELALQSANDTNSELDRLALDAEVQQLLEEIDSVTKGAAFNGRKLLDGTLSDATFQTGANVGDTIKVSIPRVDSHNLGTAASSGVSTMQSNSTDRVNAMASGDIVINGASVGAANGAVDGASTKDQDKSAIAIAAAINKASDKSGVTAKANTSSVAGTSVTSVTATAFTVAINGVSVAIAGSGNADNLAADLQAVADQINTKSGQTGVVATVDKNNLDAGVVLNAKDGRNIDIVGDATGYGLGAVGTYYGSVTMTSDTGSDIEITSNTGNSLENAGIEIGKYSGNNAVANGDKVGTNALVAGDIVLNGVSIGKSLAADDTLSTAGNAGSAIAKAAAINRASDSTGITATANTTQVLSAAVPAPSGGPPAVVAGGSATINGVNINVGESATQSEHVAKTIDAINAKTARTGVRAEAIDGTTYQLLADDGRNITIEVGVANAGLSIGITDSGAGAIAAPTPGTVHQASISLEAGGPISISTETGNGGANAGFEVGTYGGTQDGTAIKDLDIKTVKAAEKSIKAIDNALQFVNIQRAQLGAVQNRFESAIVSQSITRENLSAANSRIKDADFAVESAALSRSQVLQQAGISILGQANALPQQVLSLLQG